MRRPPAAPNPSGIWNDLNSGDSSVPAIGWKLNISVEPAAD
jgi:hypothetical protein